MRSVKISATLKTKMSNYFKNCTFYQTLQTNGGRGAGPSHGRGRGARGRRGARDKRGGGGGAPGAPGSPQAPDAAVRGGAGGQSGGRGGRRRARHNAQPERMEGIRYSAMRTALRDAGIIEGPSTPQSARQERRGRRRGRANREAEKYKKALIDIIRSGQQPQAQRGEEGAGDQQAAVVQAATATSQQQGAVGTDQQVSVQGQ